MIKLFNSLFAFVQKTLTSAILTGLPISTTLLFAEFGTLLFHLLTKGRVPAFLSSCGDRSHHHRHRSDSGTVCHQ